MDGVVCGLMRDGRDWKAAQAERPGLRLYTIREVQNALAAYGGMVAAVKDNFPGAQVVAVRSKLETDLNDHIPY